MQDYHQLDIWNRAKEVITALELCERLFSSLSRDRTQALIDEGGQISRTTYNLMRKIDPPTMSYALISWRAFRLKTQNSLLTTLSHDSFLASHTTSELRPRPQAP